MKKLLYFAGLMTLVLGVFTSCEKDDENDASIIGSWEAVEGVAEVVYNGEKLTETYEYDANEFVLVFKKDGTVEEYEDGEYDGTDSYTLKGSKLTIIYDEDEVEEYTIKTLTSKELVLLMVEEGSGYKVESTIRFKRVK